MADTTHRHHWLWPLSRYPRRFFIKLTKAAGLIFIAPAMLLVIYMLNGILAPQHAAWGLAALFITSILFAWPYTLNILALTYYVNKLAEDKRTPPPDLTYLSNIDELSLALLRLHKSWQRRKEVMENALAESALLIDSLPDALILLNDKHHIVRANSAAKIIFGGIHYRETLHAIAKEPIIAEALKDVAEQRKGKTINYHVEEIDRDYMVRIERFPAVTNGGIAYIIAMHDITELKRTEKLFSDFVANASHEIRTPLTSLKGFIETLQTSAKDDPEARDQFLNIMQEQAERMSQLIKDLLSLSEIERRMNTTPQEQVQMLKVLSDVSLHCEWMAKDRKMTLNFMMPKRTPLITGDVNELQRVFENLVINAIKYGRKETEVSVTLKHLKKAIPEGLTMDIPPEGVLAISVQDRGPGIAPEHLARLTERFYRVDSARNRERGGSGLGLAIVQRIIARHGGELVITSEVDEGSVFTVYLPVR